MFAYPALKKSSPIRIRENPFLRARGHPWHLYRASKSFQVSALESSSNRNLRCRRETDPYFSRQMLLFNLGGCALHRVSTRSGGAAGTDPPGAVVSAPGACGGPHLGGRLRRRRKRELNVEARGCPCMASVFHLTSHPCMDLTRGVLGLSPTRHRRKSLREGGTLWSGRRGISAHFLARED